MKIWKKVVALFVLILLIIVGFFWYMGCFGSYEVDVRFMGPYNFVYEEYIGPYTQSGPVFDRVYESLLEDGIGTTVGLGLYYDDPAQVLEGELRSDLGSIIDEMQSTILSEDYNLKVIDTAEYAVVKFPYRNVMSYMIGPMIAYPILGDYFGDQKFDAEYTVELYTADAIYYMIEVE